MATSQLFHSLMCFKWLRVKRFCFFLQLQTGIQIYGFTSFLLSILVADILTIKLIEEQLCQGYRNATDLLRCSATKQEILQQTCLAIMSAVLLWFKKHPWVLMFWLGCKLVVTVLEFNFLLGWGRELASQLFNVHLNSAWLAVVFIVVYLYGGLVITSYYKQLIDNQDSYSDSSNNFETNINIPIPPDLPDF